MQDSRQRMLCAYRGLGKGESFTWKVNERAILSVKNRCINGQVLELGA